MRDLNEGSEPLSIKPMLYEFVGKSKLKWLIIYMAVTYAIQLVVALESFSLLVTLAILVPFMVVIALWRFYSCNRVKHYSKESLDFLITLLKILFVLAIVSAVTMGLSTLMLLSQGLNLLVIFMLVAAAVAFVALFAYYSSAEALSQLREMYTKEVIRVDQFEIARRRWLLYGCLNIISVGLSYLIQDQYLSEVVETGKKLVDFKDLSPLIGLLGQLLAVGLPFIWSYVFCKAHDGLLKIRKDFAHTNDASVI